MPIIARLDASHRIYAAGQIGFNLELGSTSMPLTDDQIALLQGFIDDLPPSIYDAWDIIPDGYQQYFDTRIRHGIDFKKAVDAKLLNSVSWVGLNKNTKHQRYALHGAPVPSDEPLLQ